MTEFREHPSFRKMFWKTSGEGRTSCTQSEATEVELETRNGCYRTSFIFRWPEEQLKAEDLMRMLETAFACGKDRALANVRAAIGL
jgi:hypothetical protein